MKEYYVILDIQTLCFMDNGINSSIEGTEKFNTYKEAKESLKEYDDDFKGAIYKVKESIYRDFELIEED